MKLSFFLSLLFILTKATPCSAMATLVPEKIYSESGTTYAVNAQHSTRLAKKGWWGRTTTRISNAVSKGKAFFSKLMSRDKSQLAAALFALLLGIIGIHRFYLGYPVIGIIYFFTFGVFGVGFVIDFIRIIVGDLKPKHGEYIKKG